jgi:EAL domain-containing protein (putative c-di-GMP-specific phosphodiesterase class I)
MQLSDTALAHLQTLRGLGIYVAIDDFGTGQSSLARLHTLPFDIFKLEKVLPTNWIS